MSQHATAMSKSGNGQAGKGGRSGNSSDSYGSQKEAAIGHDISEAELARYMGMDGIVPLQTALEGETHDAKFLTLNPGLYSRVSGSAMRCQ